MTGAMLAESELRAETRAAVAALRAVRRFVEARRGAAEVREKAMNDIVTDTDVLVQNEMQRVLHEQQPHIAFVGEESAEQLDAKDARRMWLVDPICGTTNYAANIPLFASNIALVEDGMVVASGVADGGTGELYVAERGRGAWRIESTGLVRLGVADGYRLVSIDPEIRGRTGLDDFPTEFAIQALVQRRWDVRALSSTIALVYLASGRLAGAVYAMQDAPLHVAAGALLAEEAGAVLTDHAGAAWTLKSQILVAAATQPLHAELQFMASAVYTRLCG